MITSCKAYISERGTMNVWDQPTEELIPKLKACIHLNHEYQRHFQRTKQKLETMPNERQFEFSEMYIFGKFDTFERRLQKIIDMFDTMEMYSHLAETRIEGKKPTTMCLVLQSCLSLELDWSGVKTGQIKNTVDLHHHISPN